MRRSRDEERPATRTARGAEEPGRTPRNRGSMLPRMLAADGRGLERVPEGSRRANYPIPTVEGSPKTDRDRRSFGARVLAKEGPGQATERLRPPSRRVLEHEWYGTLMLIHPVRASNIGFGAKPIASPSGGRALGYDPEQPSEANDGRTALTKEAFPRS